MYLGDFTTANTVYVGFNTFDSNDPSASVTLTGLAVGDIKVYKNGSTTERSSTAGFTLLDTDGTDFDGNTGIHGFSLDLSDNTDSGFYAAGGEYMVVVASVTVDGATVNFIAATFSIERTGGALALLKGTNSLSDIEGKIDTLTSDLTAVKTKTDYLPSVTAGGSGGLMISGTNSGTTTLGALTITGTTTHTGATTFTGAVTASNASNNFRVNGVAPGAAGGMFIAGTNAATTITTGLTTTFTGNLTGSVGSVTGAVGSVTGNVGGNVTGSVGSVTGAVGSVTGAVGSVTGNVGGNVVGSVASVTGAVTIDGTSVDLIWDEVLSGHLTSGTTGAGLNAAGAAGDPWTTTLPGSYGAGSAGKILGDNLNAPVGTIDSVVDAIKAVTDNLPDSGALSSLSTASALATVDANVDAILVDTGTSLPNTISGLPTATENADALLNRDMSAVSDTNGRSPLNALRFLRNKWSVAGTALTVKKEDDTTTAWTATVTADAAADPITGSDPA